MDQLVGGRNLTKLILHTLLVFGLWQLRIGVLQAIATESKRERSKYRALPMYLTLVLQMSGPTCSPWNINLTWNGHLEVLGRKTFHAHPSLPPRKRRAGH